MNDGGPAFPTLGDDFMQVADGSWQPKSHYGFQGEPGMSLRAYIATAVLQGMYSEGYQNTMEVMAEEAVKQADFLLIELARVERQKASAAE